MYVCIYIISHQKKQMEYKIKSENQATKEYTNTRKIKEQMDI